MKAYLLRSVVLLLVLLNGVYFAWTQSWLQALDWTPAQQAEPHRLAQQIRPDALHILSAQELRQFEASLRTPAKPAECLQAGLFDVVQETALSHALQSGLPSGSWTLEPGVEPARWIVYMGKYPSPEVLAKKRQELAALNLKMEALQNAELSPGLSLGGHATQVQARAALDALVRRGVRTARVVQERAETRGAVLKIAVVDEVMRSRLEGLAPVLAGKPLLPCR